MVEDESLLAPMGMEDDMMAETDTEMMAEDDMMEDEMAEDEMMVTLEPGNIEGEAAECAELRVEIEGYLYDSLSMELGMMEDSM